MKSYELKPTYENLMDSFLTDTIGRNTDIFHFVDILNSVEGSCSIAIDGSWGSGKTFFVNQVKMFLDASNQFIKTFNDDDKAAIISEWKRLHKGNDPEYPPQVSVYYDAWENDSDNDPVLSLVYAILKSVDTDFSVPDDAAFVKTAANIIELFTGRNWSNLISDFRGKKPLDELRKSKNVETEVKEFLDSILQERGDRLVVFIDELDRCNPSYAVRLLERIKHYFSNDRITFVFSINTSELQHTIKRYYGDKFNACRYLDRFFDLRMSLPPVNLESFYSSIRFNATSYLYDMMCNSVIRRYDFSLREIARYLSLARMAAHDVMHDNTKKHDFLFGNEHAILFCLLYIVPIMIGLKVVDFARYEKFIQGKDSSPLLEFMDANYNPFGKLLNRDETYEECGTHSAVVSIQGKLEEVYRAIFIEAYDGATHEKRIGECTFNRKTKETILRIVSMFSKFAWLD